MSKLSRLAIVTAVLLVLAAVTAAMTYRGDASDNEDALLTRATQTATDRLISEAQTRVTSLPGQADPLDALAYAYLQKARETADSSLYTKAEKLFGESLQVRPQGQAAIVGLSSVSLARHDFAKALDYAKQALSAGTATPAVYGAMGDAQMELGQYSEAVASFQRMVDFRPDGDSYVRVSYAREIAGDTEGAIEAMKLAVEAAGPHGETAAWVRMQLGNLYFNSGHVDEAEAQYIASLEAFPGYVHAIAGRARVAAAKGDLGRAEELYETATTRIPVVQYIAALGDVYTADGRPEDAAREYGLVEAIAGLQRSNGVNTDLELAVYYADHGVNIDEAVTQARAVHDAAPSVPAADALGWSLYKSGDAAAARPFADEALRFATQDASLYYHAGMIEKALGNTEAARADLQKALEINPHFSPLQASIAEQALAEVGG
jgi:tetratricopeptide (TPR) repeat protein